VTPEIKPTTLLAHVNMLAMNKTAFNISNFGRRSAAPFRPGSAPAHRTPVSSRMRSRVVVQANPFEDAINSLTVS
jgi:hypothetical protein